MNSSGKSLSLLPWCKDSHNENLIPEQYLKHLCSLSIWTHKSCLLVIKKRDCGIQVLEQFCPGRGKLTFCKSMEIYRMARRKWNQCFSRPSGEQRTATELSLFGALMLSTSVIATTLLYLPGRLIKLNKVWLSLIISLIIIHFSVCLRKGMRYTTCLVLVQFQIQC